MTSPRHTAVYDCNVLLQAAARRTGPAGAALILVERGEVELFLSPAVLRELRNTLYALRDANVSVSLSPERIEAFLKRLRYRCNILRDVSHIFTYPRDPYDEAYLDLAATAGVEFLVTRDRDLLSLPSGHDDVSKRFRRRFRKLRVCDPSQFLAAVSGKPDKRH